MKMFIDRKHKWAVLVLVTPETKERVTNLWLGEMPKIHVGEPHKTKEEFSMLNYLDISSYDISQGFLDTTTHNNLIERLQQFYILLKYKYPTKILPLYETYIKPMLEKNMAEHKGVSSIDGMMEYELESIESGVSYLVTRHKFIVLETSGMNKCKYTIKVEILDMYNNKKWIDLDCTRVNI